MLKAKKYLDLFDCLGVSFREVKHEPVLDYAKAAEIAQRFNLTGAETKTLFLTSGKGEFFALLTLSNVRVDFKRLKEVLGKKIQVASADVLMSETGFVPGCVSPLGLRQEIAIIIDPIIFSKERLIFSPGNPEISIEIASKDFRAVLDALANEKVWL